MVRRPIINDWSIELDQPFERRVDGGDVVFWLPPRTVYATVYATKELEAEEAISKMLEGRPGMPVKTFDRAEPGLVGHAYLLPEGEGTGRYWASTRGRRRGARCAASRFISRRWTTCTGPSARGTACGAAGRAGQ